MHTIATSDDLPRIFQTLPADVSLQDLPAVLDVEIREGRYLARFARSQQEIEAALQLRFEVFNLELGEGLASSYVTGQDQDEFDDSCHHLIVLDTHEERVVGTYRLQTGEIASTAAGFYSRREFDLSLLPKGVLENSVELGRACIAKDHRNTHVLFLLWKGIAAYVAHNQKRYLFGCCSLTSQDPCEGSRVFDYLKANGHLHEQFCVSPKAGLECVCSAGARQSKTLRRAESCRSEVVLPKLFKIYLRFGAKVCGPPAIDGEFKTIDFLVIFDVDGMDQRTHTLLFGA
jgi:putative hemolysin